MNFFLCVEAKGKQRHREAPHFLCAFIFDAAKESPQNEIDNLIGSNRASARTRPTNSANLTKKPALAPSLGFCRF